MIDQHVSFVSRGGPLSRRQLISETWDKRDIVVSFARRDLQSRYKQTILGVAWAVVQPLVGVAVFTVFFGSVAGFDESTPSYAAFALSALVGWNFLASIVGSASLSIVLEAALINKIYFPRLTPILARALAALPNLLIGAVLMLLLAPVVDAKVSVQLLWVPICVAGLALASLAVAVPIASLAVYLRDFQVLVPFMLQIWLFSSPVAYPLSALSFNHKVYALLNPAVGPLEALRSIYVDAAAPDLTLLSLSALSAAVLLAVGLEVFRRLEPGFADVI